MQARVPKYRRYGQNGQYAKVVIQGREIHLGAYDSIESKAAYDRIVAEYLSSGRKIPAPARLSTQRRLDDEANIKSVLTVAELTVSYFEFASTYYRKNGKATSEVGWIKESLKALNKFYADIPVNMFGPKELKLVSEQMIKDGLARSTINQRISKIVRCFKWGVAEAVVKPETLMALRAVDGLRAGRSAAREPKRVQPVPVEHIEAIRPHVNAVPMAVIDLLLLTGARVGEITIMRTCDIDTSNDIWEYKPESHKTAYSGRDRIIFLGSKAIEIVRPYLNPDEPTEHLFQPKHAEAIRLKMLRENRKTKVQPSQVDRSKSNPKHKPGERYDATSIRIVIARACLKAGVPRFHPHQIRHTTATLIRKEFGLEHAKAILGHSSAVTTEIYAERDSEKSRDVMRQIG